MKRGPLEGRTFSLYGSHDTSDAYFREVADLVKKYRVLSHDDQVLLYILRRGSRSRHTLRQIARRGDAGTLLGALLIEAQERLSQFIHDVESYRATLSPMKRFRGSLGTTREQYLVYAMEIELMNQMNAQEFQRRERRIALLPHCLHDLSKTCQARPHGIDDVCMSCSSSCYLNAVSTLLRRQGIRPFIWMKANLRRLLRKEGGVMGVLGIACIPELIRGMRLCSRFAVPVLGHPLDANRCVRWFGEFRDNTVNLTSLEALVRGPLESSCGRKFSLDNVAGSSIL